MLRITTVYSKIVQKPTILSSKDLGKPKKAFITLCPNKDLCKKWFWTYLHSAESGSGPIGMDDFATTTRLIL